MDYEEFNKEYKTFSDWWGNDSDYSESTDYLINGAKSFVDYDVFIPEQDDRVNSPSHYTSGKTEVIDIIEDAIKDAPNPKAGMLQAQVLKYMLRLWLKDNMIEDARKAEWYLKRLIESLK